MTAPLPLHHLLARHLLACLCATGCLSAAAEPLDKPLLQCLGEPVCGDLQPDMPPTAREMANRVLQQVHALPEPEKRYLLAQRRGAAGFAIFPGVQRSGLMLASVYGKGILSYRDAAGNWSPPILLTLQGQAVGPQFGTQTNNIIFIFRTAAGIRDFLLEHHHLAPHAHGVGMEHVDHDADPMEISVHVFSRGSLFGQSSDTFSIHIDQDANAALHGVALQPGCILEGARFGLRPPWMMRFIETLQLPPGQPHRVIELDCRCSAGNAPVGRATEGDPPHDRPGGTP